METIVSCVEYVEADLNRMASDSLNDTELLSMLGGAGACQTDVVLYMVAQRKLFLPICILLILRGQAARLLTLPQQSSNQPIWNT